MAGPPGVSCGAVPHVITSKVLLEALPTSLLWGIPSPLGIQQPRGHGKTLRGKMG